MQADSSLKQIIRNALPKTTGKIVVAVSGGIDSVVLLHLLKALKDECALSLQVAHLNHCLRNQSDDDAAFVAALSAKAGLPCHLRSLDVAALARQLKISIEMAGREARRSFLLDVVNETGAELVALAHHCDDQVETFLLRLARGSGPTGLTCMRELQDHWWRPLLSVERKQIEAYARQHDLIWVEDLSNADSIFTRNLIRNQIAPRLGQVNLQYAGRIAETARQLQLDDDYWQAQITTWMGGAVVSSSGGLRVSRAALLSTHAALRFRLYRHLLLVVRGGLEGVEAVHLQAIERLLTGSRSQAQIDLPAAWIARRYEAILFRREQPDCVVFAETTLPLPGELTLPRGRCLKAVFVDKSSAETLAEVEFSVAALKLPLTLRRWRPGDRFVPSGMDGHKKLKNYFVDSQVESEERAAALVLTSGEQILWIVGMRRSAHARVSSDCSKILRLTLI